MLVFIEKKMFQGRPQYIQILNINMYLLTEIRHGSYIEVKNSIILRKIDIFRNSSQDLDVLRGV